MEMISVADTKAHLSELLARVEEGEEIVITRRGKPVARLRSRQKEFADYTGAGTSVPYEHQTRLKPHFLCVGYRAVRQISACFRNHL